MKLKLKNIETLWAEITLPNATLFFICTVYRPPCANSEWIDLFEVEFSIAQTTDLEIISMGDFNFDFGINLNKKWHNLIEIFDLTQFISKPTRVTESSSTIIVHIYSTNPEI